MSSRRICGILILGLLLGPALVTATPASAQSFCPGVPGTQYNPGVINWALNDANRALAGCRRTRAAWANCVRADRALNRADVAIDQMLRHCTGVNCRRYRLDGLVRHARRLAGLSRALQRRSGMRRTYENSYGKLLGWQRTRLCTGPRTRTPGRVCRWENAFGRRGCYCVFTNDPTVKRGMPPSYCSGLR